MKNMYEEIGLDLQALLKEYMMIFYINQHFIIF